MDPIIDRILNPAIVWVFVPLLAVAFWGLASVVRALRGVPEEVADLEQWKSEVQQLRERVEALERAQRKPAPEGTPAVTAAFRS